MTSVLEGGRGSPKSRGKEQNQLISVNDKGERGSKKPKNLRTSYMEAPFCKGPSRECATRVAPG